ncbi:MAG TPA: MlaD family protein [Solirubrobacteraceae bacterium]|jgi:virulence factor Mce-like protein|nr:MlaD family protein [Solirubrobacteraceae bacterium]
MRRVALIALALLGGLGAFAGLGRASGSHPSTYRVDVIFDDARGLIPGQLVKVAGARVGTIDGISLTPDFKARIEMKVDGRFAPFRSNASCTIRPEGLIAENYVACDPGTPAGQPLLPSGTHPATVPVSQTTEPVTLTDLFNIWNVPTRDRLTVLINELGIGNAARGADVNAILRRANPALALARRAIAILRHQRAQLAATVDSSDRLLAAVARRSGRVQDFVVHAAHVTGQVAAHRGELSSAIARLPTLLGVARPALRKLDVVARTGTPLLTELRASVPAVNRLSVDLVPFARAVRPALSSVGQTLTLGTRTARESRAGLHALRVYSEQSLPGAQLTGSLFVNLRDRGFFENLLHFFYNSAAAGARFDSISHILPSRVSFDCSAYAQTPVAGCSARYTTTRTARARRPRASTPANGAPGRSAPASPTAPSIRPHGPGAGPPPALPSLPHLPPVPLPAPRLPQLGPGALPPVPPGPAGPAGPGRIGPLPPGAPADRRLKSLLGYLLR